MLQWEIILSLEHLRNFDEKGEKKNKNEATEFDWGTKF